MCRATRPAPGRSQAAYQEYGLRTARAHPDQAAQNAVGNGGHMVDGQPCVNTGRDLLRPLANAGHIRAAGHAERKQQVIQNETGGHYRHGPVRRQQPGGKRVSQAQQGQCNAVENRDIPLPEPLDTPPDQRLRSQTDHSGNQQGLPDMLRRLTQRTDHQPEPECKIQLLADAVQNLQPVINGVPALENKTFPPPAALGKHGRLHPAQEHGRQQAHAAHDEKIHGKGLVELPLDPDA